MTAAEIVSIVLGSLSLLATIAVSFFIYWLQSRHEKEIQKLDEKRGQKELEEKAHVFLSENRDEQDYLPWCIIAANQHRHEKHTRKIYTNYCRCSEELQAEILKQAGFTLEPIVGREWVDFCFKGVKKDIKQYKLGKREFLYDGAKYFHRGFERYRDKAYKLDDLSATTVSYNKSSREALFNDTTIEFNCYFDDYWAAMSGEIGYEELGESDPIPPVDFIWDAQMLGSASEEIVCYWVMDLVEEITVNKYNLQEGLDGVLFENTTDAQSITYEDKYYEIMLWLYYTYFEPANMVVTNAKKGSEKRSKNTMLRHRNQRKTK